LNDAQTPLVRSVVDLSNSKSHNKLYGTTIQRRILQSTPLVKCGPSTSVKLLCYNTTCRLTVHFRSAADFFCTTRSATERSPSLRATRSWNSLPSEVTSSQCLRTFKTKLKTRLFSASFQSTAVCKLTADVPLAFFTLNYTVLYCTANHSKRSLCLSTQMNNPTMNKRYCGLASV